ncbi:MAG: alpha/beta hydrolase-fold protein, partial [Patulibacter minatonensis]
MHTHQSGARPVVDAFPVASCSDRRTVHGGARRRAGPRPRPPAGAAQRLETIDLPSNGNVDLVQSRLNRPATKLQANVLLPDGYDADTGKRWPVFYLLGGVGDNWNAWADKRKGNAQELLKDFPGIVVMPESGRGYFVDWWRGNKRDGSSWETYYLTEVVPQIEARYRIAGGRANHAIGGPLDGWLRRHEPVGRVPSYFGNAISLSGLLDNQAPGSTTVLPDRHRLAVHAHLGFADRPLRGGPQPGQARRTAQEHA